MMFDSKPKTVLEALYGVEALLSDPKRWGKLSFYRQGRYCLVGALYSLFSRPGRLTDVPRKYPLAVQTFLFMREQVGGSLYFFNDDVHRDHADLMAALHRMIVAAGGEPPVRRGTETQVARLKALMVTAAKTARENADAIGATVLVASVMSILSYVV